MNYNELIINIRKIFRYFSNGQFYGTMSRIRKFQWTWISFCPYDNDKRTLENRSLAENFLYTEILAIIQNFNENFSLIVWWVFFKKFKGDGIMSV